MDGLNYPSLEENLAQGDFTDRTHDDPCTLGTLIKLAREGGWEGKTKTATEVFKDAEPLGDPAEGTGNPEPDARAATDTFPMLSGAELFERPDISYLVSGVIPARSIGLIYGDWGSYKSFMAVDLAYRWAAGMEVWGRKSHHSRPVAYIASENSTGIRKRIKGFLLKHGLNEKECPVHVISAAPQLLDDDDMDKLVRTLKKKNFGLIIIDTLSKSIAGQDENSQKDMSLLTR